LRSLCTWQRCTSATSPKRSRTAFSQRLGAVEDHQQTPIGPQAATLEVRQQRLAERCVLGRAFPQAEGVFLAVGGDPQGHDQAVLADMDAVEDQADEIEAVERLRLPGFQ
jgi:hypothetical protein